MDIDSCFYKGCLVDHLALVLLHMFQRYNLVLQSTLLLNGKNVLDLLVVYTVR